jgi:hypothetical protein
MLWHSNLHHVRHFLRFARWYSPHSFFHSNAKTLHFLPSLSFSNNAFSISPQWAPPALNIVKNMLMTKTNIGESDESYRIVFFFSPLVCVEFVPGFTWNVHSPHSILLSISHVILPKELSKTLPKSRLLTETEWRQIGVQQSRGWTHYAIHRYVCCLCLSLERRKRSYSHWRNGPRDVYYGAFCTMELSWFRVPFKWNHFCVISSLKPYNFFFSLL